MGRGRKRRDSTEYNPEEDQCGERESRDQSQRDGKDQACWAGPGDSIPGGK